MNTQDLVKVISSDSGLTKVQADRVLNAFTINLTAALKKNEKIYIAGFGTFMTTRVPADSSSEALKAGSASANLETARIPQFKPGNELLSAVR